MRLLITGGVKSGKSRRALEVAQSLWSFPRYFLATAEAFDEEMRTRIDRHKKERKNSEGKDEFITIEEPLWINRAIQHCAGPVIIDCIPLWINNILYYQKEGDFFSIREDFLTHLPPDCIIVTNETGWGNIPADTLSRHYNLLLGETNILLAQKVEQVELMVAGIPVRIK
jgi:adenosylcobinamide kinase/adenosylcobinamide-phosphate guanylyltransferase